MSFILIRGERIDASGINVRQAVDLGIPEFPDGQPHSYSRRGEAVDKITLHWTGGERSDARGVYDTLVSRGFGAHFFVDKEGTIVQYLDLFKATLHASPSAKTIGIEIQNKGFFRDGRAYDREVYEANHLGRNVEYLKFTAAQTDAVKRLCRILCNYYNIPYQVPKENGELIKRSLTRSEIRAFSGIVGHYHLTDSGKRDPGLDLLLAINGETLSSTADPAVNPTPQESRSRRAQRSPQEQEIPIERIEALTHGRTETPSDQIFGYGILTDAEDASTLDPHVDSEAGINPSLAGNIISAPYEKWYNQMVALRQMTNLDLTQTVPVIQILVRENNDVINLNERIFGASTFKNIFESETEFRERSPERPIASIENFTVDVQSPSAGGGEGQITIGKLNLKIHNPHLVHAAHPQGKYISYMMRASYAMRIRYGVSPTINSQTNKEDTISEALQWVEQDYYVAQHEVSINDDLTMNMVLTLMPGAEKLFNQVLIGESFPADATSIETENARVSQDQQTNDDIQKLITLATNVSGTYGGINTYRRPDGSLGSVLHGMTRNIDTILSPEGPENIQVRRENLVNALRSIQSGLLTQRTENLLNDFAYLYTRPGDANLQYVAVNAGPFIEKMVRPELNHVVSFLANNDLRLGTIFSTQINDSDANTSANNEPPPRTSVQMVFGNFNDKAGDWAGKPISTFPLNIEQILEYVRENRDVGKFNGSINNFINRIHTIISNQSNYIIDRSSSDNRFATPIIKYTFYPHPLDPTSWIFYLYDQKQRAIGFSEALRKIADSEGKLTKDDIKSLCATHRIPWIEPGLNSSLIRTLQASTQADDQIASANLYAANSGFTTRQMDASNVPRGISREFVQGLQLNLNEHIARTTVLLPLHLSLDHYIAVTTILFGHIYIFFPLKQFSGLFTAYQLQHEVQKDRASTKMTLNIQITRANQSAD